MKKCLAVAIFAIVAATKASAVGTASRVHLNALVEENARLKALNERLRTQVLKKVGGSAERLHKIAHASSSSFLETAASPEADGKGKKKGGEKGKGKGKGKKDGPGAAPPVAVDGGAAVQR